MPKGAVQYVATNNHAEYSTENLQEQLWTCAHGKIAPHGKLVEQLLMPDPTVQKQGDRMQTDAGICQHSLARQPSL